MNFTYDIKVVWKPLDCKTQINWILFGPLSCFETQKHRIKFHPIKKIIKKIYVSHKLAQTVAWFVKNWLEWPMFCPKIASFFSFLLCIELTKRGNIENLLDSIHLIVYNKINSIINQLNWVLLAEFNFITFYDRFIPNELIIQNQFYSWILNPITFYPPWHHHIVFR